MVSVFFSISFPGSSLGTRWKKAPIPPAYGSIAVMVITSGTMLGSEGTSRVMVTVAVLDPAIEYLNYMVLPEHDGRVRAGCIIHG